MSIQNKRIALLTEQILKRNLQQGILPNSREFVWQLNQALRKSGGANLLSLFKLTGIQPWPAATV